MSRVHVIAEAGTNHGGRLDLAEQLVDIAAEAGADSVKFQIIYPEGLYLPEFYSAGGNVRNDVFDARARAQLSDTEYARLAAHCRAAGIPFSASVFDERGLDLLDELDAPYIKIASCDLNNTPFLRKAAGRGRKLIVSTGMSTLAEVETAVAALNEEGQEDLVLTHCVSVYPCATEEVNLGFMTDLSREFGFPVGLSDHTENSLAGAMAIALGATWIEKHFTMDRKADGFDHAYAMEPEGLGRYISDLRTAERAMHANAQKVGESEAGVRARARRSLYAARPISAGDVLRESDVLIVRPEAELGPGDLSAVIGRKTTRDIARYEAISQAAIG